jgi:hypothetical protein
MRANRAYRLIVGRAGHMPALLAEPDRLDHIEVVEIESGEVVFFWDCRPRDATRLARRLRADLAQSDVDEFLAHWSEVDGAALPE